MNITTITIVICTVIFCGWIHDTFAIPAIADIVVPEIRNKRATYDGYGGEFSGLANGNWIMRRKRDDSSTNTPKPINTIQRVSSRNTRATYDAYEGVINGLADGNWIMRRKRDDSSTNTPKPINTIQRVSNRETRATYDNYQGELAEYPMERIARDTESVSVNAHAETSSSASGEFEDKESSGNSGNIVTNTANNIQTTVSNAISDAGIMILQATNQIPSVIERAAINTMNTTVTMVDNAVGITKNVQNTASSVVNSSEKTAGQVSNVTGTAVESGQVIAQTAGDVASKTSTAWHVLSAILKVPESAIVESIKVPVDGVISLIMIPLGPFVEIVRGPTNLVIGIIKVPVDATKNTISATWEVSKVLLSPTKKVLSATTGVVGSGYKAVEKRFIGVLQSICEWIARTWGSIRAKVRNAAAGYEVSGEVSVSRRRRDAESPSLVSRIVALPIRIMGTVVSGGYKVFRVAFKFFLSSTTICMDNGEVTFPSSGLLISNSTEYMQRVICYVVSKFNESGQRIITAAFIRAWDLSRSVLIPWLDTVLVEMAESGRLSTNLTGMINRFDQMYQFLKSLQYVS